jgi:hypothetical protein
LECHDLRDAVTKDLNPTPSNEEDEEKVSGLDALEIVDDIIKKIKSKNKGWGKYTKWLTKKKLIGFGAAGLGGLAGGAAAYKYGYTPSFMDDMPNKIKKKLLDLVGGKKGSTLSKQQIKELEAIARQAGLKEGRRSGLATGALGALGAAAAGAGLYNYRKPIYNYKGLGKKLKDMFSSSSEEGSGNEGGEQEKKTEKTTKKTPDLWGPPEDPASSSSSSPSSSLAPLLRFLIPLRTN